LPKQRFKTFRLPVHEQRTSAEVPMQKMRESFYLKWLDSLLYKFYDKLWDYAWRMKNDWLLFHAIMGILDHCPDLNYEVEK